MGFRTNLEQSKAFKKLRFKQSERPSFLLVEYEKCNVFGTNSNGLKIGDLIGHYVPGKTVNSLEWEEAVEWVFKKYEYSIEVELNIPESGEYDGCYVFNGVIKGAQDYKLKTFYRSKDYPTREKAFSDVIDEFLKKYGN